jgi:predicted nuclease with TOPRIM domain
VDEYDLRVKISGDGQSLRDDIDEDKAKVDELDQKLAEVRDKDVALNVETEAAKKDIDEVKGDLATVEDKTVDIKADDVQLQAKLSEIKDEPTEDKYIDLKLNDAGYYEAIATVEEEPTVDKEIKLKLDDTLFQEKLATDEAEVAAAEVESVKASNTGTKTGPTIGAFLRSLFKLPSNPDKEEKIPQGGLVGQLMNSLGSADLNKPKDLQKTEAQLDRVKYMLDEINKTQSTIHVDDAKAQAEVDKLSAKVDDLVFRTLKLSVDDTDATTKIKELYADLGALRASYARIPIGVEDGSALEKIDAIKMDLDTLHGKTVDVKVKESGGGGKGGFSLGTIIGGLLPVASPLAADAGGGIMGLLSALAPGMAGGAGYTAVAGSTLMPVFAAESSLKTAEAQYQAILNNPAATNAQKLQALQAVHQSTANLNGGQMQALGQVQQFGTFMQGFDKSFQPQVLQSFTSVLQLLQNLLKNLAPAIHGFASGLNELLSEANKALGSPVWKSFFSYLGANAKSSILAFGQGLGNLATGFASLLMAFNPLAKSMDAGWTKMTASFAHWAANVSKSKGFQQFLDYVKQTGPQVLSLIGNLGGIIVKLFQAMAPAGQNVLSMVNGLASLANTLLKVNPLVGQIVVGIIQMVAFKSVLGWVSGVGGGFTKLGTTLMSTTGFVGKLVKVFPGLEGVMKLVGSGAGLLGKAFTLLGGPWGLLIAAIVAGAFLIIGHWKQISAEAEKLWKDVSAFFKQLGHDVVKLWDGMWKAIKDEIDKIGLAPYLKGYWDYIKGVFKVFLDLLTGNWSKAWTDMKTALTNIWNDIKNTTLGHMLTDALNWGENLVHMIGNGIMNGIHWVTNAVNAVANQVKSFLGFHSPTEEGPGSEADVWMPNLMKMLTNGIQQGTPALRAALNNALGMPTWAVSSGVAGMVTGATNASLAPQLLQVLVKHEGNVLVSGLTPRAINQVNQELNTQLLRKMR